MRAVRGLVLLIGVDVPSRVLHGIASNESVCRSGACANLDRANAASTVAQSFERGLVGRQRAAFDAVGSLAVNAGCRAFDAGCEAEK